MTSVVLLSAELLKKYLLRKEIKKFRKLQLEYGSKSLVILNTESILSNISAVHLNLNNNILRYNELNIQVFPLDLR